MRRGSIEEVEGAMHDALLDLAPPLIEVGKLSKQPESPQTFDLAGFLLSLSHATSIS